MRTVGLKLLKNRLSEYIRAVANGETLLVTDRDRVVAELRPPTLRGPLVSDALLSDLVRKGWLSPPMIVAQGAPPRKTIAPFDQLRAELDEDRRDR